MADRLLVPGAIDETARLLKEAELPADARRPAGALVEKLRTSRPGWVDAGGARTADDFLKALGKVDEHPIQEDVRRLRTRPGAAGPGARGGGA
ncbi:hypothetical protein ACFCYM_04235 [Streptomyces sp. NPDC056254]|uniref:hypothetical protein n=1 Tax=Streptomyces sp. NPDC056254 TaxID=3345763 RepID=UPI0035DC06A2